MIILFKTRVLPNFDSTQKMLAVGVLKLKLREFNS